MKHNKHLHQGFTLIEVLVTTSIAALILTLAVPSFADFVSNSRLRTAANNFVSSLHQAKAEASSRAVNVTVCVSNANRDGCSNPSPADWNNGWLVFADLDDDQVLDVGEEILHSNTALNSAINFRVTPTISNAITFRPSGSIRYMNGTTQTQVTATQTFVICDDRGFMDQSRAIILTMAGYASVYQAAETGQTDCLQGI